VKLRQSRQSCQSDAARHAMVWAALEDVKQHPSKLAHLAACFTSPPAVAKHEDNATIPKSRKRKKKEGSSSLTKSEEQQRGPAAHLCNTGREAAAGSVSPPHGILKKGERLSVYFTEGATGWYAGRIVDRAEWGTQVCVHFDDGEMLWTSLHLDDEGSKWRREPPIYMAPAGIPGCTAGGSSKVGPPLSGGSHRPAARVKSTKHSKGAPSHSVRSGAEAASSPANEQASKLSASGIKQLQKPQIPQTPEEPFQADKVDPFGFNDNEEDAEDILMSPRDNMPLSMINSVRGQKTSFDALVAECHPQHIFGPRGAMSIRGGI